VKAIVQRRYGSPDNLAISDVDNPTPGADEVLVRVHAASVHPDVWHVVRGVPYVLRLMGAGVRRPKQRIPGTDLAGTVESVGESVTRFAPGDEVFGEVTTGSQWCNGGTYAELATSPADHLAGIPAGISFKDAAALPNAGSIAYQTLHVQAAVQPGHHVLVNGAGGGVGTIAVQLAKAEGAEVTGVDSTEKLGLLEDIGADHVVDYTVADFTEASDRYDLVVDIPGNHPYSAIKGVLEPDGKYVIVGHDDYDAVGRRYFGSIPRFFKLLALSYVDDHLSGMKFSIPSKGEAIAALAALLESGELIPVVDNTYPLDEVSEAIRFLESGAVIGRIVIDVD